MMTDIEVCDLRRWAVSQAFLMYSSASRSTVDEKTILDSAEKFLKFARDGKLPDA